MGKTSRGLFGMGLLLGLSGLMALAPLASLAQPTPVPAPRPKTGMTPPASAVQPARPGNPVPLGPQPVQQVPSRPGGLFSGLGQTTAFDANQRALIDRVNVYLMSLQTLVGDFVQVGPDGSKTGGRFYLQKPGRVKFEYNPPSPIELVADGSSLVVRDRKLATQDLYPLGQTPLRFLLADRIDLMRDTNVVSVGADDLFVSIAIEERQTLGGTHRLLLMFSAKDMQLKQWTVTDPQGYDTTVAIYNLDASKKLDPSMFYINYERKELYQ